MFMSVPSELKFSLETRRATRKLGEHLGDVLRPADLVVLSGELGAGKTFLVRALARRMGLPHEYPVTSPTFALLQELETSPPLVHADLYRLGAEESVSELGLWEHRNEGAIVIVEWGEPFVAQLGGDALVIALDLSPRSARVSATGETAAQRLEALRSKL